MKIHLNLPLLLILALSLTACSKPIEQRIIGKWQEENSSSNLEFFQDNTIIMNINGQNVSGKWLKVGDNRFKTEVVIGGVPVGAMVMEVADITKDTLTLETDGKVGSFTRVK